MALDEFRVVGTKSGNSPETRYFPENGAGSTFVRGQCVVINNAGKIEEAINNGPVLGIAAESAAGVANHQTAVWLLNDDTIFEAEADADVALTDREITCDLAVATGVHLVDKGTSADETFKIVEVDTPATGEKTCRVTGGPGSMAIMADPVFPAAST